MNILYEDKDILVVEKPAGIPVETSRIGSKDMVSLLKNHLAETGGKPGGIPYLGMIHRLDQPVQGVMVFSKNQKAAASLSKEIAQNEMKKTYLAVVEGTAKEEESLTDYLLKDGRTNTSKKVPKGTKGAKESRLSYECLKTLEDPALAALPLSLVWTAVWVCILLNDPVYQLISRPVWLGMLVLAAVYFCYAIGKLQTHCETLWEGTTSWL